MAEVPAHPVGSIAWTDLTVPNATEVRDFHARVVGWKPTEHPMGDYADYNILRPGGECVAGICHARGSNTGLPAQWLIHVIVESVEASAAACRANGGEVLDGPRPKGGEAFCVIKDPAGAVMALMEGQGGREQGDPQQGRTRHGVGKCRGLGRGRPGYWPWRGRTGLGRRSA